MSALLAAENAALPDPWDLSCPDWEARLLAGRSLVPDLPLNEAEAAMGLAIFDELRLPDVPGLPYMRDAAGPWFRDIVRVAFGSWFPELAWRAIRDIFAMLPKGQSKTTYVAALLLTAMLMNRRPRAEGLFVGPTQAISDNAYDKAVGMIDASPDLKRRFRPRDHVKTIEDLANRSELRVKTFDLNILTGSILFIAMLDELHLLGRNAHTTKVLRQIRGGLEKTPEGLLIITTTQSDEIPAGAFREELRFARGVRDGAHRGKRVRPMLPVLYEFPPAIARDPAQWQDEANWPLVMPNLGRSVHLASLAADWESERAKGEHAMRIWASQHLNIEIGVGLSTDDWLGAQFWEAAEDETIGLETMLAECEVIVAGVDGGGLDDLYGLALIGRHAQTRDWWLWCRAWAHPEVLERRKELVSRLQDFAADGDLVLCERPAQDIEEIADLIASVRDAGKLAAKSAVGLDPVGISALVDALAVRGIGQEQVIGVPQGYKLSGAVWGMERKLNDGTLWHARQPLMDWCVGNAKVEVRGNAVLVTKQAAGRAKIDPLTAAFDAFMLMSRNPEPTGGRSIYAERGVLVL